MLNLVIVTTSKHAAKRKNIPPSGLEAQRTSLRESLPKIQYAYNPHLPPILRFETIIYIREVLAQGKTRRGKTRITQDDYRQLVHGINPRPDEWIADFAQPPKLADGQMSDFGIER